LWGEVPLELAFRLKIIDRTWFDHSSLFIWWPGCSAGVCVSGILSRRWGSMVAHFHCVYAVLHHPEYRERRLLRPELAFEDFLNLIWT
jgi:hypothetical protein